MKRKVAPSMARVANIRSLHLEFFDKLRIFFDRLDESDLVRVDVWLVRSCGTFARPIPLYEVANPLKLSSEFEADLLDLFQDIRQLLIWIELLKIVERYWQILPDLKRLLLGESSHEDGVGNTRRVTVCRWGLAVYQGNQCHFVALPLQLLSHLKSYQPAE